MTSDNAFDLWLRHTAPGLADMADRPEGFEARATVSWMRSAWDARKLYELNLALPEARRVWP